MSYSDLPLNWVDEYESSINRTVLTERELAVPGLRMIGHQAIRSAAPALPLHFHDDAFELVVVTSGEFHFDIGSAHYRPKVGDVFFVQPNIPHSTSSNPMSPGEIYWLQLCCGDGCEILDLNAAVSKDLTDRLRSLGNGIIHLEESWQYGIIARAFRIAEQNRGGAAASVSSYISCFLNILTEPHGESLSAVTPDISRSVAFIMEHLQDEIDLSVLAEVACLSLSQFKQKFRRQMHISPRSYINQQKIDLAKSLLLRHASVTEVSQMLSFDSPAYFSVVFKKYTAQTPSEFIRGNIELL